jgi:hypothetical protein
MSTGKSFDYLDAKVLQNFEILNIFDHHSKELFNQHWKMDDEIFNWGESLISQIKETVNERRRLLDQEYKNQQHYLEEKRREYLDKALIYEKNKENEQIGQLKTQCNALKFELTALEFSMRPLPYLTLVTQDNLKHEQFRSIPIERHENDTVIRLHTAESSPSIITSKNTKIKRSVSISIHLQIIQFSNSVAVNGHWSPNLRTKRINRSPILII